MLSFALLIFSDDKCEFLFELWLSFSIFKTTTKQVLYYTSLLLDTCIDDRSTRAKPIFLNVLYRNSVKLNDLDLLCFHRAG